MTEESLEKRLEDTPEAENPLADASLEKKADEPTSFWNDLYRKATGLLGMGASTAVATAITGSLASTLSMGAGLVGSYLYSKIKKKEPIRFKEISSEYHAAMAAATAVDVTMPPINAVDNSSVTGMLKRYAIGTAVQNPAFLAGYGGTGYATREYTPSSFYQKIKKDGLYNATKDVLRNGAFKDFGKTSLDVIKYLSLPLFLMWNFVPAEYVIPASAAISFMFGRVKDKQNKPADYPLKQYDKPLTYNPN